MKLNDNSEDSEYASEVITIIYSYVRKKSIFLRKPSGFHWSPLAWGDLGPSYACVIFSRLSSIASVDCKQHLSEGTFIMRKMMERLEQRTWFRLFGDISWYQKSKEPSKPQESGLLPKKSESSALLQSFCHFPYNENPTRALNTTSLKCCLPSTDVIDRWEKIHACIWRFKVVSCKVFGKKVG